ncbi:MAG TPA: tRNA glutamyl-Q(34) synthetase GluQRS [Gammaproteobacteria bacterium]|nr:tRNA glutamyl-Q(34) synthetase GluQRS [Gammaproteobacteria bacterium]
MDPAANTPSTKNQSATCRGRFAPSPSGPLHFGSLVAALGSFLSIRAQGGEWLLRIDDIDPPRNVPGAADGILRTLENYQLFWDGPVFYQSQRFEAYAAALTQLASHSYPCGCTRREISAVSPNHRYPGTCRNGLPPGRQARSLRVYCGGQTLCFTDALQGRQCRQLDDDIGDFIVRRADGFYAYHLATALDDAFQQVTEVVRGADLLDATFPQLYLQQLLELPRPTYLHLPIAVTTAGKKLSKQARARAINDSPPGTVLSRALTFLGQPPPEELRGAAPGELLDWAIAHWQPACLPCSKTITTDADETGA